jgi:hypothetical protein
MQYSRLVRDAWALTWRHRFLWVFAFFGGAESGGCGLNYQGGFSSGRADGLPLPSRAELGQVGEAVEEWASANVGLILTVGLLLLMLVLALLVVSFIARGALISSTARVALGEPTTTGQGWATGRRLAWRYVRLTILLMLIGLLGVLTLGVIALLFVALSAVSQVLAIVLGILVGVAALLGLIALGIAFSVVVTFAQRAIALDDLGARAGLRRGIALVRLRTVDSLALWGLSLVIGIVTAIVVVAIVLVLALPLGGLGVVAYLTSGLGAETLLVGLFAVLVLISVLWVVGAIAGTFTSGFWTLAYLSMTQRYPPAGDAGTV